MVSLAQSSAMANSPTIQLGCAQNPDGTLKSASEITFTFSRSSSPAIPPLPDLKTQPKARSRKLVTQKKITVTQKLVTTSVTKERKTSLEKSKKLEVLDFYHSSGFIQEKVAEHFEGQWEGVTQANISRWLKAEVKLCAATNSVTGETDSK